MLDTEGRLWQLQGSSEEWKQLQGGFNPQLMASASATAWRNHTCYGIDKDNKLWEIKFQCRPLPQWPSVRLLAHSTDGILAEDLEGNLWRDHGYGGPRKVPVDGPTFPLRDMAGGQAHWVIIDPSGVLWACDWDIRRAANIKRVDGVPLLVQVAVRSGGLSVAALDEAGRVWMGTTWTQWNSATWSMMEGLPEIVRVAAGWDHCIAQDLDGRLWGWGRNDNNEIGLDSQEPSEATAVPRLLPHHLPLKRAKSARSAVP